MKKRIFVFIFLILSVSAFSQIDTNDFSKCFRPAITLDYLYGKVNDNGVENVGSSHYGKVAFLNQTGHQEGSFFKDYNSPLVGFTFLGGYLGHKDVFGSVFALYPTWSYHFFKDRTLGWDVTFGTGFAYFTKPFDKITNPDNKLVGAHFSNVTELSANLIFRVNPMLFIRAGAGVHHFSNGHTAMPNIGVNDLSVRLGLVYKPGALVGMEMPTRRRFVGDSVWRKNFTFTYGRHELAHSIYPVDGPTYNVFGLGLGLSRQFGYIHEFYCGASITYYDSYHTWIVRDELYSHFKYFRASTIALHAGHEFLLQHFGFVTDVGIKLHDPIVRNYLLPDKTVMNTLKKIFAFKAGLEVYPYKNAFSGQKLSLGMYIKTNFIQADFVEFNTTFTF